MTSLQDILNSTEEELQVQEIIDYKYQYTTTNSIMRKLRSRLRITQGGSNIYNTTNWINLGVDEDLVHQIILEQEDFLNMYLQMVYTLPLKNTHYILTKCIDGLVISELMKIHSTSGAETSDPSGYGGGLKQDSLNIIKSLTYDLNVAIPGLPPEPKDRINTHTLILPGEDLLTSKIRQPLSSDVWLTMHLNDKDAKRQIQQKYEFDINRYDFR